MPEDQKSPVKCKAPCTIGWPQDQLKSVPSEEIRFKDQKMPCSRLLGYYSLVSHKYSEAEDFFKSYYTKTKVLKR